MREGDTAARTGHLTKHISPPFRLFKCMHFLCKSSTVVVCLFSVFVVVDHHASIKAHIAPYHTKWPSGLMCFPFDNMNLQGRANMDKQTTYISFREYICAPGTVNTYCTRPESCNQAYIYLQNTGYHHAIHHTICPSQSVCFCTFHIQALKSHRCLHSG